MMSGDDNVDQKIFGDLGGLKLPDICLTGEEKPQKNLTQETCPDRGLNPGPLHGRCSCYRLPHSGGSEHWKLVLWWLPGKWLLPECIMRTRKFDSGGMMVQECFSYCSVGPLVVVCGSMNSQKYCTILGNEMLPSLWCFYGMDPC